MNGVSGIGTCGERVHPEQGEATCSVLCGGCVVCAETQEYKTDEGHRDVHERQRGWGKEGGDLRETRGRAGADYGPISGGLHNGKGNSS